MIYELEADMEPYLTVNPDEESDLYYLIVKSKTPEAIFKKFKEIDDESFEYTGEHQFAFSE